MDSSLSVSEFNAILLALRQTHNSIIKLLELYLPKGRQLPKQVTFLKRKQKDLDYGGLGVPFTIFFLFFTSNTLILFSKMK